MPLIATFTAPGTYTPATGVRRILVKAWGGGAAADAEQGGGGGAYASKVCGVTAGTPYTVHPGEVSGVADGEGSYFDNASRVFAAGGKRTGAGGAVADCIGTTKYHGGRGRGIVPAGGSYTQQITDGANDSALYDPGVTNSFNNNDTNIQAGAFNNKQYHNVLHFTNVTIDQGAVLDSAVLTFNTHATGFPATSAEVACEAVDDATNPTVAADVIAAVANTTTSVPWIVGAATPVADQTYTLNITAALQEIIDRPGWVSGNDINLLIFNGTATFSNVMFKSADNGDGKGPQLDIDGGAGSTDPGGGGSSASDAGNGSDATGTAGGIAPVGGGNGGNGNPSGTGSVGSAPGGGAGGGTGSDALGSVGRVEIWDAPERTCCRWPCCNCGGSGSGCNSFSLAEQHLVIAQWVEANFPDEIDVTISGIDAIDFLSLCGVNCDTYYNKTFTLQKSEGYRLIIEPDCSSDCTGVTSIYLNITPSPNHLLDREYADVKCAYFLSVFLIQDTGIDWFDEGAPTGTDCKPSFVAWHYIFGFGTSSGSPIPSGTYNFPFLMNGGGLNHCQMDLSISADAIVEFP